MSEPEYRDVLPDENVMAGDQYWVFGRDWRPASAYVGTPPAVGMLYRRKIEPEYRMLEEGELIAADDEYMNRAARWVPIDARVVGNEWVPEWCLPHRRRVASDEAHVPEYVVFHTVGDNAWFVLAIHDGDCLSWTEHYYKAMKFPVSLVDPWTKVLSSLTGIRVKAHNTKYGFLDGGYGGNAG